MLSSTGAPALQCRSEKISTDKLWNDIEPGVKGYISRLVPGLTEDEVALRVNNVRRFIEQVMKDDADGVDFAATPYFIEGFNPKHQYSVNGIIKYLRQQNFTLPNEQQLLANPDLLTAIYAANWQLRRETGELLYPGEKAYFMLNSRKIGTWGESWQEVTVAETKVWMGAAIYSFQGWHPETEYHTAAKSLLIVDVTEPRNILGQPATYTPETKFLAKRNGIPSLPKRPLKVVLADGAEASGIFFTAAEMYATEDEGGVENNASETAPGKKAQDFYESLELSSRIRGDIYLFITDNEGNGIGLITGIAGEQVRGDWAEICCYIDPAFADNDVLTQAAPTMLAEMNRRWGVYKFFMRTGESVGSDTAKKAGFSLTANNHPGLAEFTNYSGNPDRYLGIDLSEQLQRLPPTILTELSSDPSLLLADAPLFQPSPNAMSIWEYGNGISALSQNPENKTVRQRIEDANVLVKLSPRNSMNGYRIDGYGDVLKALADTGEPELWTHGLAILDEALLSTNKEDNLKASDSNQRARNELRHILREKYLTVDKLAANPQYGERVLNKFFDLEVGDKYGLGMFQTKSFVQTYGQFLSPALIARYLATTPVVDAVNFASCLPREKIGRGDAEILARRLIADWDNGNIQLNRTKARDAILPMLPDEELRKQVMQLG